MALHPFKKNKVWIWKAYDRYNNRLVDWVCGDRSAQTLSLLLERLKGFKIYFFCTDHFEVYRSLIPAESLYQGKDKTVAIERNNCLQRHWFARFKRKSIVASKSLTMIDLSIGLFAASHINKTASLCDLSIC